jgi:tripartite-type tricarboxylate transporter receptor subunit TctC
MIVKCLGKFAAALILLACASNMPSHAGSALDGATIRIIIAHKAGNTTDTMARLFAKTLEKYLPDSSINVQNLDGNGGSLAMAEIHDAKASLVTVGFVNSSVVFSQ